MSCAYIDEFKVLAPYRKSKDGQIIITFNEFNRDLS
jgi:hypothetical protein